VILQVFSWHLALESVLISSISVISVEVLTLQCHLRYAAAKKVLVSASILVALSVVLHWFYPSHNINQQASRMVLTRVKSTTKLQCRRHLLLSILGRIIAGC